MKYSKKLTFFSFTNNPQPFICGGYPGGGYIKKTIQR